MGCVAYDYTDVPPDTVIRHYLEQFRQPGWVVVTVDGAAVGATKDGVRVHVQTYASEGGLVMVVIVE